MSTPGIFVSRYHSIGQWDEFKFKGLIGWFDRYVKPLLRADINVMDWYPFSEHPSLTGRTFKFTDCYDQPGLFEVAERIANAGADYICYLPLPRDRDFHADATIARSQMRRLLAHVPPTASIAIDMLHSLPDEGPIAAQVLEDECDRRVVIAENWWPRYNETWWDNPITINQDEYLRHHNNPDWRAKEPHMPNVIVGHLDNRLYTDDKTREVRVTRLRQFTTWAMKSGYDWLVPAEVLVNSTPPMTLAEVMPQLSVSPGPRP